MPLFNKPKAEPEKQLPTLPQDAMGEFYANMEKVTGAMNSGGTVDKNFREDSHVHDLYQQIKRSYRPESDQKSPNEVSKPELQKQYNSKSLPRRILMSMLGGRKKVLGREAQMQAEQKRESEEEKAQEKYEKEFNKNKVNINHAYVRLEKLATDTRKKTRNGVLKFDPHLAKEALEAHQEMSLLIEEFGEDQILRYLGQKGRKSLSTMLQFYNSIPGNYNISKTRIGENTPKYGTNKQTRKSHTTSTEKRSEQNGSCLGRLAISFALVGVVVLGGKVAIDSSQNHDDSTKTIAPYMTPSPYDVYPNPTPTLAPLRTTK